MGKKSDNLPITAVIFMFLGGFFFAAALAARGIEAQTAVFTPTWPPPSTSLLPQALITATPLPSPGSTSTPTPTPVNSEHLPLILRVYLSPTPGPSPTPTLIKTTTPLPPP